jgi:hypothetical protein
MNLFKRRKKEEIIRPVTKAGWYDVNITQPLVGQKVQLDCNGQIREAVYCSPRFPLMTWVATDCDHPMQNINLSGANICGWRPFDKNGSITEDAEFEIIEPKQLPESNQSK